MKSYMILFSDIALATVYTMTIKTTVTKIVTPALTMRRMAEDLPVGPNRLRNVLQKMRV